MTRRWHLRRFLEAIMPTLDRTATGLSILAFVLLIIVFPMWWAR